nr:glutaredoxin domain-containing protein [Rhodococcus sp. (in: high G+C Gram-positive bacteria)]
MTRWVLAAIAAICGFLLVTFGNAATSAVLAVVLLLVVVGLSTTLFYPRSAGDSAARARSAASGLPLIYWRPGCIFCFRLRLFMLLRGRRAVWMNIHTDDAASARVRSVNDGNETVPTVFLGEKHHTNPSPSWVAAQG